MGLLFFNSKKMFFLSCVILVAGSLVQGLPIKQEYQRIRCMPGDNDIACAQERAIFEQDPESNIIDRGPISRKVQTHIPSMPFPVEDAGSGIYSGEDPGSASENYAYSNEIQESKQYISEENLIM